MEKEKLMNSWRDYVRTVTPYTPGEQPKETDIIKLNTNENPYPPSPAVLRALAETEEESLRRYPDPKASALVDAIAKRHDVDREQVFVGVGSDDVLAMAFLTFFNGDKEILFPDISYSFYPVWAEAFRIPYRQVALDADLAITPADYAAENGGVIFPNPNAPTGIAMPLEAVEEIVRANEQSLVIVDEAYVEFGAASALPLALRYDNLLVVRTFSKSRAMAGARIGYAIGCAELIRALNAFKYAFNSYTLSAMQIRIGAASIEDEAYYKEKIEAVVRTREWAKSEFRKRGFCFPDSQANFLFVTHETRSARALYEALRERRIYTRYFAAPRIDNYLRVTIGTEEEMRALFAALDACAI